MSSKAMSLKGRIKNYAKSKSIAAQVVLQNYMFERFLARLSLSEYREKFVVKGGMLIAAIVGLDTRSTMDLDTTLLLRGSGTLNSYTLLAPCLKILVQIKNHVKTAPICTREKLKSAIPVGMIKEGYYE